MAGTKLARIFGVDIRTIYNIIHRKTWKHVKPYKSKLRELLGERGEAGEKDGL